ncbi:HNH endonuclease [Jannaschia sp. Os4]|uniref:HNH endonuclease n=1 Tax=Jannaschia sp. Os4 TaxID=2807617 RepID=UPI00193AD2F0|nr:HNH endonuclease [Jannaschia sp. Os4]MBM2575367.1 HNH endonuclease [Jannaschia sp. Os4]
MPNKVVLDTKQGSAYDDATAERYHFPSRYLQPLRAAEGGWAVFRRPRDGGGGITYFGAGRIARIRADPDRPSYYYAEIADYLPFSDPVPWRSKGRYGEDALRRIAEDDVSRIGIYLRGRSVRPLEDDDFVALVDAGLKTLDRPDEAFRWQFEVDRNDDEPHGAERRERRLVDRAVRDALFRKAVCEAYDDRCAVTRLRIINGGGRSEVQAAHIKPVRDGGRDIVQNGLALSATAHWLFDRHLISIDPQYRLLVAHNRVPEEFRRLLSSAVERIHLPTDERLHPSERFMAEHRNRFAGAT